MTISNLQISNARLAVTIVAIVALLVATSGFKACSQTEKDRNVAFAKDILASCKAAAPIIARKSPQFVAVWSVVTDDAGKLVDAAAASDATTMGALVRSMLPTVTDVIGSLSSDESFQSAFALAQIGLNFFLDHVLPPAATPVGQAGQPSAAPAAGKSRSAATAISDGDAGIVERYRALPQFGCRLHPERCQ
jgi:hypothetical protein